ncbi:uncharacterized protein LOC141850085 [Brevipalpus obovatus]|uniref:uncharacterized protein LOC141850085 n=1 Tax=Brevipalpus obovatus TaxID=246614 RepID=UPI003D9FA19C
MMKGYQRLEECEECEVLWLLFLVFIFSIVHNYSANPSKLSTLMAPLADPNSNINSTQVRSGDGLSTGKSVNSGTRDNKLGKNPTGDEENADSPAKEEINRVDNVPSSPSLAHIRADRLSAPRISTVIHKDGHGDVEPVDFLERQSDKNTSTTNEPPSTKSGADYGHNSFPALIISLLVPMIGWSLSCL